jgi:hypothetical protein
MINFYKIGNLLDDEDIEEHVEFASKDNNLQFSSMDSTKL